MQRRSLFKTAVVAVCAGGGIGAGFWASFSEDDPLPDLRELSDGVTLPELSTRQELEHPHANINETKVREAMIAKANASFAFAAKYNFIEPLLKACDLTGISPMAMMCLTSFESDMGRNIVIKTAARKDDPQSAHGIAQITEGVFAYLMAKYETPVHKAIAANPDLCSDADTRAALHAMNFISFDAPNGKPLFDLEAYAQVLRPPLKPKNKKQKIVAAKVESGDKEKLLAQLGRGRSNALVSLFVVGSDLMNSAPYVRSDNIPVDVQDVKFRLDHWLGLKRANAVLNACNTKPSTTMQEAFGRTDAQVGDQKMNIFGDNSILPQMRVDDFLKLTFLQYRIVQETLRSCYAFYVPPPKPQPTPAPASHLAAMRPALKPVEKVSAKTRRDWLHLTRR